MDILSKEKEAGEKGGIKRGGEGDRGVETCKAQSQLCVGRGGGGGGPVNQPASCQHLPPAPPPGASEATELRITNGRHWPGKKL